MLRRQRQDAVDVEASAESTNESTCLITPLTNDDISSGNSREYGGLEEQNIAHSEDPEAVVKKKGNKGSKNSAAGSRKTPDDMDQEIHEQAGL